MDIKLPPVGPAHRAPEPSRRIAEMRAEQHAKDVEKLEAVKDALSLYVLMVFVFLAGFHFHALKMLLEHRCFC